MTSFFGTNSRGVGGAAAAVLGRGSEHHNRVLAGLMACAMPWPAEGVPAQLDVSGLPAPIAQLGARDG